MTPDEGLGKGAAALVVSLAVFETWKAYTARATRYGLVDADMSVAPLVAIAAIAMYAFTKDLRISALLVLSFAGLSGWHHLFIDRTTTLDKATP